MALGATSERRGSGDRYGKGYDGGKTCRQVKDTVTSGGSSNSNISSPSCGQRSVLARHVVDAALRRSFRRSCYHRHGSENTIVRLRSCGDAWVFEQLEPYTYDASPDDICGLQLCFCALALSSLFPIRASSDLGPHSLYCIATASLRSHLDQLYNVRITILHLYRS